MVNVGKYTFRPMDPSWGLFPPIFFVLCCFNGATHLGQGTSAKPPPGARSSCVSNFGRFKNTLMSGVHCVLTMEKKNEFMGKSLVSDGFEITVSPCILNN